MLAANTLVRFTTDIACPMDVVRGGITFHKSGLYCAIASSTGTGYTSERAESNAVQCPVYSMHRRLNQTEMPSGSTQKGHGDPDICDCLPTPPPTNAPTEAPTNAPTEAPTEAPTQSPTEAPTNAPTPHPTQTLEVTSLMVETAEDPFSSAEVVLGGEGGGSQGTIRLVRTVSPAIPSGDNFVIRRGNDTDLLTFERGSKDGAIIVNADGVTIKDLTVTGNLRTPGGRRLGEETGDREEETNVQNSCNCQDQGELERRVDELEQRLRYLHDLFAKQSTQLPTE